VRSVELLHYWLNLRLLQVEQEQASLSAPAGGVDGGSRQAGSEKGQELASESTHQRVAREKHEKHARKKDKTAQKAAVAAAAQGKLLLRREPLCAVQDKALAQCTHLPSVVTWYTCAPVYGRASPVGAAAEGWHEGATVSAHGEGDECTSSDDDDIDDIVVLETTRDTPLNGKSNVNLEKQGIPNGKNDGTQDVGSSNQVVDEGVGLGWWWRPRREAAADGQTGDVSVLDKVFGETWASRSKRRRQLSIYGAHEGWRLRPLIVKAGDDLRQEQFAMQLISCITRMWRDAGLSLRVKTYDILATSPSTGLMEMVSDTVSLAGLRKQHTPFVSLEAFYFAAFGDGSDGKLQQAQTNFVRSMAAYSLICYILKVKDRHDGNILLQRDGSVVHIDWGYMLGRSMNAVLEVERAPFKLTRDHVAVMGGEMSANFISYISLCVQGLQVLRERGSELVELVRAMNIGSPLMCVNAGEIAELEERLALKYSEKEVVERFILLQGQALGNWSTGAYDLLQTFLGV